MIQIEHLDFNLKPVLSISELNQYRQKYIANYLISEVGELNALEHDVLKTLQDHDPISNKINLESDSSKFTFGQRLADHIATFGGHWRFIIIFGVFIVV
ncbi:hypothetical protein [Psychroserpens burtonensis]|uniref:hypothetical protein n=1 Tax=Psychroserpens burtonensis TaxID=49278 RepID=UPI0004230468|nr:hypothetical protein [Psychroserpens burtonensis]